ncbi:uncharacterized protein [Sinocyclocheilus grahami]|uniref:uncharacterized protein n=1 Tax=Sinocyclocheilus grahami TaxID=75366 RepID=UPI0007ACEA11|nr:PREDICTED: uncharacterized protein LOC107569435 [Sinocyclocheilus grahami]
MCLLFTLITCFVITAGAVSDNEIVKVNRGESFPLFVRASEPKIVSLRKIHRNGTQEVFRYCSSEEQKHGCKPVTSGRFSHSTDEEDFSVTVFAASTSDAGVYRLEVIDAKNRSIQQKFTVALTEQLPSTINPEPPSTHPLSTPAVSTKGKETLGTNGPNTTVSTEQNSKITWCIIGGLSGVITGAIVVTGIICYRKRKKNNHIADDDTEDPGEGTHLNSNTNGAGEPATDESLEIVIDTNLSVDNEEGPELGA